MEGNVFKPSMSSNQVPRTKNEEFRIVMVGKTGNGKSATANTILGRECFESKFQAKSVTIDCSKGSAVVGAERVAVIDTPGLFDTRFTETQTTKFVQQCVSYAAPGPHVFLVVIRLGRFTEEEKQTVQKIQEIFGQAADKYSMVLFTCGDSLEGTIEEFLEGSSELQELVARCNSQYHVFNNKKNDRFQVTELLQKIRNIVLKNGGSHYTNKMLQEAEREIEEQKQRLLDEQREKIRREKEEMEKKVHEKYERQMKEINAELQAERARERKEREEERSREKQEINEERMRQNEDRQREMLNMMQQLQEQYRRDLQESQNALMERYDRQARHQAERMRQQHNCVIL